MTTEVKVSWSAEGGDLHGLQLPQAEDFHEPEHPTHFDLDDRGEQARGAEVGLGEGLEVIREREKTPSMRGFFRATTRPGFPQIL